MRCFISFITGHMCGTIIGVCDIIVADVVVLFVENSAVEAKVGAVNKKIHEIATIRCI